LENILIKTKKRQKRLSNCILTILSASPKVLITRDHRQVYEENLPEVWEREFRSTSQPDCNPLDYFVCGVSEL
jgi:IS1 family transposase